MNISGDSVVTQKREGTGRDDIKKCQQTLPLFLMSERFE